MEQTRIADDPTTTTTSDSSSTRVNASDLDGLRWLALLSAGKKNGQATGAAEGSSCADQDHHGTSRSSDGAIKTAKEVDDDDSLCSNWKKKERDDDCATATAPRVTFDANGCVTFLDWGGMRLHRGFSPAALEAVFPRSSSSRCFPFPALIGLNLAGTDLLAQQLCRILLALPGLEGAHLGGNGLGDAGIAALATTALSGSSSSKLIKLDVRYNDITGRGMTALCAGLAKTRVKYLHLEGNQIGDEGCQALAALLQRQRGDNDERSCQLAHVFLGGNRIGPVGAAALAGAIRTNRTLVKLYLEGNGIGEAGATAFSEALEQTEATVLQNLFVDNNNIGKAGSQRLARALQSATAIPEL
jgi:Leucine Rich repeat